MPYRASDPLRTWRSERRAAITTLQRAHAATGEVTGPGRPREIGRPLAHAYVLRVVAEFQGFARDLHDLVVLKLVEHADPVPQYRPVLVAAAREGRRIDRGNADLPSLVADFNRVGIEALGRRLAVRNPRWAPGPGRRGDRVTYTDLIRLRNSLAHGNQTQVDGLRREGTLDTVTWTRARLPALDRMARALDRVVWDHLRDTYGWEPW